MSKQVSKQEATKTGTGKVTEWVTVKEMIAIAQDEEQASYVYVSGKYLGQPAERTYPVTLAVKSECRMPGVPLRYRLRFVGYQVWTEPLSLEERFQVVDRSLDKLDYAATGMAYREPRGRTVRGKSIE